MGRMIGLGAIGLIFLGLITILGGSWYTIDQGERGVVLRNGAILAEADPGLNFKLPILDDVERISLREQSAKWICYDNQCVENGDWPVMQAYSKDQQPADIRVSVNFAIPSGEVSKLYTEYGSTGNLVSRSLARKVPQAVKQTFGKYNAQTAVVERQRLSQESLAALQAMMQDEPIIITSLQIENIDYSEAYENAVESRMLAEVEVAKRNQQLEQEKINAQIVETQAIGAAKAKQAAADAEAYSIKARGDAEAGAIRARGSALRDNPLLIQLTTAEKWDGVLPSTIPPNGTVPLLNLTAP